MKKIFLKIIFIAILIFAPISHVRNAALAANEAVADNNAFQQILTDENRFGYLGWWGQINANNIPVYDSASNLSKKMGKFSKANRIKVLGEVQGQVIDGNGLWFKIDGGAFPDAYVFSANVTPIAQPKPPLEVKIPAIVMPGDYWIDVNLTAQVLTLFQYEKPIFATYVSTGRVGRNTVRGVYRIKYKLLKTRMRGGIPGTSSYYNLANVPYTMYYYGSYGIHGTYWHDKFGTRQSSGCTNLTQGDAKYIFDIVGPKLEDGMRSVWFSADNMGTVVYNHY